MKTAITRLTRLISADIRQVAGEAIAARRPQPTHVRVDGIELTVGPWINPTIRQALLNGAFETEERDVVMATLKSDDVVIELGSGTGYITTLAAGIARKVKSFEANPEMTMIARATVASNDRSADVENAVVTRDATSSTVPFYLAETFWVSSLIPIEGARLIEVPVSEFADAIEGCTYLIADIEGAEVELLTGELPGIRAICVECHPLVVSSRAISEMLRSLFDQGFALDLAISRGQVLYLARD